MRVRPFVVELFDIRDGVCYESDCGVAARDIMTLEFAHAAVSPVLFL
jgi:hypothetical protein